MFGWVVSINTNLPSCRRVMPSVTELSLRKWEHPPQRRGWSWQDWAILGDNPSAQTSLVTTGAPIQETHPALGMEKLTRAYEAAGWYHLSRKPGKLFDWIAQIISKPSRTGWGVCEYLLQACASILKISSLKKPGANTQQTFWFLSRKVTKCLSVSSCGARRQRAWTDNVPRS